MSPELLDQFSTEMLHGHPVPPFLQLLWDDQDEAEFPVLLMANEATLVDSLEGGLLEDYSPEVVEDPALSKAYQSMFKEIAFFAGEADGGIVGFWLRDVTDLEKAPIIYLDNEGCFRILGRNLPEYLVNASIDEEEQEEIKQWIAENDPSFDLGSLKSYDDIQSLVPSPDEAFDAYWER